MNSFHCGPTPSLSMSKLWCPGHGCVDIICIWGLYLFGRYGTAMFIFLPVGICSEFCPPLGRVIVIFLVLVGFRFSLACSCPCRVGILLCWSHSAVSANHLGVCTDWHIYSVHVSRWVRSWFPIYLVLEHVFPFPSVTLFGLGSDCSCTLLMGLGWLMISHVPGWLIS